MKSFQIRLLCEKHGVNARAGRSDPVPQRAWDVQNEVSGSEDKNPVLLVEDAETEELLRCKVTRLEATVRSLVCAVGVEQHARAEDEKLRKKMLEELQAAQSARTAAECACQVSLRAQLLSSCLFCAGLRASLPAFRDRRDVLRAPVVETGRERGQRCAAGGTGSVHREGSGAWPDRCLFGR